MTPPAFRFRLKALGLTIRGFATLTGVNQTTVSYWGRERPGSGLQAFPVWVALMLNAWEAEAWAAKVIDRLLVLTPSRDINAADDALAWLRAYEQPEWWLTVSTRDLMEQQP